jgi:hypothetical protein
MFVKVIFLVRIMENHVGKSYKVRDQLEIVHLDIFGYV